MLYTPTVLFPEHTESPRGEGKLRWSVVDEWRADPKPQSNLYRHKQNHHLELEKRLPTLLYNPTGPDPFSYRRPPTTIVREDGNSLNCPHPPPPVLFGRMEPAPPLSPPNSHVVREDGDSPHPSPSSTRKTVRRLGPSTGAWHWRLCCVGQVSKSIDGRQREKGE